MTAERFYDQVIAMLDQELGELDGELTVWQLRHVRNRFEAIAGGALADYHEREARFDRATKESVHGC